MAIKVGINGFGRIGRLAFRKMFVDDAFDIVAINGLNETKDVAYLLKYDSAQGSFMVDDISYTENELVVKNKKVKVLKEREPAKIQWDKLGVDIVLECTGAFTQKEKAMEHIKAGAKKVVVSAPVKGDVKTIVYNVNHDILDGSEQIISAASCTTNCLAPMAKVLNDKLGIEEGFMTTVHAYTNDQNTLDGFHAKGDLRRGRAAAENIIPNSTGAAKAIGLVIPELEGKLDGSAQRVPVITGSITELVTLVSKSTSIEAVNKMMKEAVNDSYGYNEDEIVSSDIIGMSYGSLFDATQTKVLDLGGKTMVKTAAWYDNEMSYTTQLVKTIKYLGTK